MMDLTLSDLMNMQKELLDKHKDEWAPLTPEGGRNCLLWMVEELGEIISVIKKRGENAIMTDSIVREAFIEEFVDVLMFMNEALLCYDVTAEELSMVFVKKHLRNMQRDWETENAKYIRQE